MSLEIKGDGRLNEWVRVFEEIQKGSARRGFNDALNKSAAKSTTQVKRALVQQAGMPFREVSANMRITRSTPATLQYEIEQSGDETNIRDFRARATRSGVSAAPWGTRQTFESTFFVPRFGKKVFKRMGDERLPIRSVWGPSLPREILKNEPPKRWQEVLGDLEVQVQSQFRRLLMRGFR